MCPLVLLVADLTVRQSLGHLLHDGARGFVDREQLVLQAVEDSNLWLTILQGGNGVAAATHHNNCAQLPVTHLSMGRMQARLPCS